MSILGIGNRTQKFYWLSNYLENRRLAQRVRVMMFCLCFAMAAALLGLLLGNDGPRGTVAAAMTWTAFAGGLFGAAIWAVKWPSYHQSLAFGIVSSTSTALASLAHHEALASLIGCFAFATVGAYFAFFHSKFWSIVNLAVAVCVIFIEAGKLVLLGDHALAFADVLLALQINIAMPMAILVLIASMRDDLLQADRDPLTGLLNRRGMMLQIDQIAKSVEDGNRIFVLLIDLDSFKLINDTHGHLAGDEVLRDVASTLRSVTPHSAVIARCGGEEFLIADAGSERAQNSLELARIVCVSIGRLRTPVTASVGIAHAVVQRNRLSFCESFLEELIEAADTAMYQAKKRGGNQYCDYGQVTNMAPGHRSRTRE